jgi:hypothetical protein
MTTGFDNMFTNSCLLGQCNAESGCLSKGAILEKKNSWREKTMDDLGFSQLRA